MQCGKAAQRIPALPLTLAMGTLAMGLPARVFAAGPGTGVAEDPLALDRLAGLTVMLAIIVAIILVAGFFLRRFRGFASGSAGGMKVRGHLALGPKERIVLVEAGDTQLLVGLTPGRLQTLHVLDTPIDTAQADRSARTAEAPAGGFAERLRSAMARRET